MSIRQSRKPEVPGPGRTDSSGSRRVRLQLRRIVLGLSLALLLAGVLAPAGQANGSAAEGVAASTGTKAAEKEERLALRAREKEERAAIALAERERRLAERLASHGKSVAELSAHRTMLYTDERPNGNVEFGCTQVVWNFHSQQQGEHVIEERLRIGRQVLAYSTFVYTGTEAQDIMPIHAPPGTDTIHAIASWRKLPGEQYARLAIAQKIVCERAPAVRLEAAQTIAGSGGYTSSPITGQEGQTVDYEFVANNTGNVPLVISGFSGPNCDAETISGGPSATVPVGGSSAPFYCTHLLDAADLAAGSYTSSASIQARGINEDEAQAPLSGTSNTVSASVIAPSVETVTSATSTTTTNTVTVPAPAASATPPGKSGVLGFSTTSVPSLKGPTGCVRNASFQVSLRSAGVASVTFYLGGHELKTLSAKNARKGLLTLTLNRAKLRGGANKLSAKITMAKTATAAKAIQATRTLTIHRCSVTTATPKHA
jgi:hypothetical protein